MSAPSLALDTSDLAANYERISVDRQFKAGQELIERIGVREGQRVLDVGSGTGLLAEHVAGIVGPSGSVHGVDPLPLRIELAKRKAKPNLTFAVDDAFDLSSLPSESFDVVYLNAVFHWFPEKLKPLQNFQRLLKPGGTLGLSTGSRAHPNLINSISKAVLEREPFKAHLQSSPTLAKHVTTEELAELLAQTGFEVLSSTIETKSSIVFADAEAALQHFEASSFGNFLSDVPESLRAQARREIAVELDKGRTPEGIRHSGGRIVAIARKGKLA